MTYFDPGHGELVIVDGQIVERDALHIAERIKDYDPNLEILCLDPERAESITDAPFVICERLPNGQLVRIFEAWSLDASVLERVARADQSKFNALDTIEEAERKFRAANERRYQEKRLEIQDLVASVAASKKSSFSFTDRNGEKVTLYEDRPAERVR
jgi:hypothetical protein